MADYIDRQAALDCFTYESGDMIPETLETGEENTISVKTVKAVLRSIPAADVAPVVRGRWIFNDDWWEFRCTNCHKSIGNIEKYKYCPHCGARMDGTEENG